MDPVGVRRRRASLYLRLSHKAGDTNTSKEEMIKEVRALCEREGYDEYALHVDDGKSGAIRDRPEFGDWLDDARAGRVDCLIAHHVDRMTREGLNVAATILDVIEGKDVRTGKVVRSPVRLLDTMGLDSNNGVAFRMLFLMRAEIAREERERIKERMAGRSTRLRLRGRYAGGPPPFGYQAVPLDTGGKTLALHPDEAEWVKRAASRVLDGHTLGAVSRWLNAHGAKPRRAREWTRTTLGQSLTGDHILGRVVIGHVLQRDAEGKPIVAFPAVLDLPTVTRLRKLLEKTPDARKRAGRRPSRLLSRLVVCGACGQPLDVVHRAAYRTRAEVDKGYAERPGLITYRCQTRAEGGTCPRPVLASAVPMEDHVEACFLADFGHAPMVERRLTMPGDVPLAETEEEIAHVLALLGSDATAETFARLQALQARKAELVALPREPVIELVYTGLTMAEEWEARDVAGKRELLADAYDVIALGPGKPGKRGFDGDRLTLIPAEGDPDPDGWD